MLHASALLIDAEMLREVSDTKGQILCDSTSVRYPELAKSQTESRIRAAGLGGEGSRELVFGDRVWDDDEALGTAVVTGARPRE